MCPTELFFLFVGLLTNSNIRNKSSPKYCYCLICALGMIEFHYLTQMNKFSRYMSAQRDEADRRKTIFKTQLIVAWPPSLRVPVYIYYLRFPPAVPVACVVVT